MKRLSGHILIHLVLLASILTACKKEETDAPPVPTPETKLYDKGKAVYMARCTACHHSDPKKSGSLGPEVFASNRELLELRILKAEYPQGYTPKRKTKLMTPMPELANDIEALYSYLNEN